MPGPIRLWRGLATTTLAVFAIAGANAGASAGHNARVHQVRAAADPAVAQRLARVQQALFSATPDLQAAIRELTSILALDPQSRDAHVLLGIAYRGLGTQEFIAESVAEFRQALAIAPNDPQARVYLAYSYRDLGRLDRAREELQTALGQVPADPQVLALLGDTERQLSNPARALELEQRALAADAQFLQARYYLGLTLLDLGRRDEGIIELDKVVKAGAPVADAYVALGSAYLDANRVREAIDVLTRGVALDGGRPDLRLQLARAYRLNGALAQARVELTRAAAGRTTTKLDAQRTDFTLALEQGLLALAQNDLPGASRALESALTMEPDNGAANRGLAIVYLRQGVYARAADHAVKAEAAGAPLAEADRALIRQKTGREPVQP